MDLLAFCICRNPVLLAAFVEDAVFPPTMCIYGFFKTTTTTTTTKVTSFPQVCGFTSGCSVQLISVFVYVNIMLFLKIIIVL